jgi:hypothetical protein
MKHVTYGEKSLFLDDATADALVEYAVLVGDAQRSDAVTVPAWGGDGNRVDATFLLNASSVLVTETTDAPDPDPPLTDGTLLADLRARIARLSDPRPVQAGEDPRSRVLDGEAIV